MCEVACDPSGLWPCDCLTVSSTACSSLCFSPRADKLTLSLEGKFGCLAFSWLFRVSHSEFLFRGGGGMCSGRSFGGGSSGGRGQVSRTDPQVPSPGCLRCGGSV